MSHTAPTYVAQPDDPFLVFNLPLFDFSEPSFEFFVTQTIFASVTRGAVLAYIYIYGQEPAAAQRTFFDLPVLNRVNTFGRECPSYKTGYCLHD